MKLRIVEEVNLMTPEDELMLVELRRKLPIDIYELEYECNNQSILYDEVGSWVATIKADARIAKKHVSFVEAALRLKIRKDPKSFGLTDGKKYTLDIVSALVETNSEYIKAFEEYVEAERLANEASTLLESVAERKSGVRDLVRLYVNDYFSKADEVTHEDWKVGQDAIIAMRNKRAAEEDLSEDNLVEHD